MAKTCKFKIFVDNVSDASIKLNDVERNVIEAPENTLVKWIVSKEGYQSDMGEVTLGSSVAITVHLARNGAKVKNTYTKIYKDEDGKYVSEQSELSPIGKCLPPSEGKEGNVLSVSKGGFLNWTDPSGEGSDLSELKRAVQEHEVKIEELEESSDSLAERLTTAEGALALKADEEDVSILAREMSLKADQTDLEHLSGELEADKKNLADNYWNTSETSGQIEAAVGALEASMSVALNGKANKATTLIGYGITNAYTKEEVDAKASSFMKYKGQVDTTNKLPSEPNVGDVYNVKSTGANYCWNGESWDKLSEDIDLSGYLTKSEANTEFALKANTADVEAALVFKAGKSETEAALALKADKTELPTIPTNVSSFANDAGYLTEHQSLDALATKAALQAEAERAQAAEALKANKSELPVVPENVSAFNNDAGYLTEHQSLDALATKAALQAESERAVAAEALKANAADMEVALAAKLTKSELIKADGTLYNKVTKNGNDALLWNEVDGGGAQFKNNSANVVSFVGVNDEGPTGVCAQIYSKYIADKAEAEQTKNVGTRLNINPTGMFYTNGRTNGSFDPADELATKGNVAAAKSELNESLALKANTTDMEVALAAKLTKSELIKADGTLYNKVIKNGNEALLWNEVDGGGAQFKNNTANVVSFVGVNDEGPTGVCAQIYSKYIADDAGAEQAKNVGTRLNINPTGMFYTNGRTNGAFDPADELATKGTVDAAKGELNEALDLKADKSELPEIPENVSAFNNDAGYLTEHQSLEALATKEELNAGLETKLTKSDLINAKGFLNNTVTLANGNQTQLWNEASGGGSLFQNNVDNVKSFIGVNDEDPSGVCAQIYSKYINNNAEAEQVANKGSRLNINPTGMYYTSGKTSGGDFGPADELATKGDVTAEAGRADAALDTKASLADFESLAGQLRVLNDRLSEMAKSNKEDVVPTGEAMTIGDATKDFTLAGDLDNKLRVTESKSFAADGVAITANVAEAIVVKADEEATFKNCEVTCDMPHGAGTNVIKVHDSKYITIRDMTFTGYTYNTIMTGQAQNSSITQPIKSLVIENCEFKEFAYHVNIWAASFEDNAVVTINNCHFYNCDEQVFAFSNATLAKNITINITNCVIDNYEKGDEYEGFIFCQDYNKPATAEAFAERNMFKEMTINISNVTVCGEKLTKENFKMGTGAAGQMLYVYGDKLYMYDPDIYPTVNVM